MATTDCTLGTRFAKRKFLAKTDKLHLTEPFLASCSSVFDSSALDPPTSDSFTSESSTPDSTSINSDTFDETLAELMETLRSQVSSLLRFDIATQKRSRLVRNYWELEYLVKELRVFVVSETGGGGGV